MKLQSRNQPVTLFLKIMTALWKFLKKRFLLDVLERNLCGDFVERAQNVKQEK